MQMSRKRLIAVAPPAPTTTAPATISAITEATTASASTAAFGLGPGFIHVECAPTNL